MPLPHPQTYKRLMHEPEYLVFSTPGALHTLLKLYFFSALPHLVY